MRFPLSLHQGYLYGLRRCAGPIVLATSDQFEHCIALVVEMFSENSAHRHTIAAGEGHRSCARAHRRRAAILPVLIGAEAQRLQAGIELGIGAR